MKREGRQHGVVRTYPILPSPWDPTPQHRHANTFNSPPTAGLFTKVSTKPTNHSKFTGKCGRVRCSDCHVHPARKAKDKAKGTLKRRRAGTVDANRPGLSFSGLSATGILDHLAGDDCTDDHEGDQYEETIGHDDDDDRMSLCEAAGYVWEQLQEDDEDGWCLVVAE